MKVEKIAKIFGIIFLVLVLGGMILSAWLAIKDYQENQAYRLKTQQNSKK